MARRKVFIAHSTNHRKLAADTDHKPTVIVLFLILSTSHIYLLTHIHMSTSAHGTITHHSHLSGAFGGFSVLSKDTLKYGPEELRIEPPAFWLVSGRATSQAQHPTNWGERVVLSVRLYDNLTLSDTRDMFRAWFLPIKWWWRRPAEGIESGVSWDCRRVSQHPYQIESRRL